MLVYKAGFAAAAVLNSTIALAAGARTVECVDSKKNLLPIEEEFGTVAFCTVRKTGQKQVRKSKPVLRVVRSIGWVLRIWLLVSIAFWVSGTRRYFLFGTSGIRRRNPNFLL